MTARSPLVSWGVSLRGILPEAENLRPVGAGGGPAEHAEIRVTLLAQRTAGGGFPGVAEDTISHAVPYPVLPAKEVVTCSTGTALHIVLFAESAASLDAAQYLLLGGEAAFLMLAEDSHVIYPDIENAASTAVELAVHAQVVLEVGRETRGPGFVISDAAVLNSDLHGSGSFADREHEGNPESGASRLMPA